MKNDGQKPQGRTNGAFRAFSSYLRIVSSGASTVASTVRSAASAIVDRVDDASNDQVLWAGFDKLECDGGTTRQVLLLAYRSGFQVWDVEEADNVSSLVSRHDGSVSFLQVLPKPIIIKKSNKKTEDCFADYRPLLAICADASLSGGGNKTSPNGNVPQNGGGGFIPTVVWFYSLRSQSYLHVLKFRSPIYSVRCSTRVVAIAQTAQIHCLDAATLKKEYTILTNPIVAGCSSTFGGIGYGPLAVGARWLAYSGSPVAVSSNTGRVDPQHLTPASSVPASASNRNLVAHYAKESSKQLAAGIVTLGDMGYKKLSKYYSEIVPDGHNSSQNGNLGLKPSGIVNGHLPDPESVGMVIVRDIVSKSPIAQFRAHESPISSLCFDPSGTLLVTASVQGHNINVFRIMPSALDENSDSNPSCIHLYRLQRGVTNAVIQDISFSDDSRWIMISSSRGTNHLFAISPFGGPIDFLLPDTNSTSRMLSQQNMYASGPPITVSVVSRIRSGNSGWKSTVSGAAASAAGRSSFLSGAIACVFHNCKANALLESITTPLKPNLLVFSSGSMVQYAMREASLGQEFATVVSGNGSYGSAAPDADVKLVIEAMQKWDICRKHVRREREDNSDIYGENGNLERSKVFPEEIERSFPRGSFGKAKVSPDEKHHMFISEAELQMHEASIPLWAKSKIYFQCMTTNDGGKVDEECGHGGEIKIERLPFRTIEAKSKHLVPVFDYLRTPKSQPFSHRISDSDKATDRRPDSMVNGGARFTEWEGLLHMQQQIDTMNGFVNSSNHSPKASPQLDLVVNNRQSLMAKEAQITLVNNVEGHKTENQVQDDACL